MILERPSSTFLASRTTLTLPEVRWAFDNGIIGAQTVVDVARDTWTNGSDAPVVVALAALDNEALPSVTEILSKIPLSAADEGEVQRKWVWLLLSSLYERHHEDADVLVTVDALYDDLGYPEEMTPFGPYAPACQAKGDPHAQREQVMKEWRRYLDEGAASFGR